MPRVRRIDDLGYERVERAGLALALCLRIEELERVVGW